MSFKQWASPNSVIDIPSTPSEIYDWYEKAKRERCECHDCVQGRLHLLQWDKPIHIPAEKKEK